MAAAMDDTSPSDGLQATQLHAKTADSCRPSAFHSLPTELLLFIGLDSPGLTLSVLAQVCRRFRYTFKELGEELWVDEFKTTLRYNPPYFDGQDLTDYYLAIKRDFARRRYDRERELRVDDRTFCSSCSTAHPRSQFADHQPSVPIDLRRCKDVETGGIQTCPDLVIPFFALQSLRHFEPDFAENSLALSGQHADPAIDCPTALGLHFCSETRRRDFLHPIDGFGLNPPCIDEPMRYTEKWTYKLVAQYMVCKEEGSPRQPLVRSLIEALKTSTGMLCPHVRMNSAEVFKCASGKRGLPAEEITSIPWIACRWAAPLPGEPFQATRVSTCRHVDCDTKWRFILALDGNVSIVQLVVQRDVGKLEDPTDAKWLAQRTLPLGLLP